MSNNTSSIVSKVWSFCNPLRNIGVGYCDFGVESTLVIIVEPLIQTLLQDVTLRQSILKKAFDGELINIKALI